MFKFLTFLLLLVAIIAGGIWFLNQQDDSDLETNKPIKEQEETPQANEDKDEQTSRLSLEEKIGQMMFVGIEGTSLTEMEKKLITNYHVGGVILFKENLTDPEQAVQLINELKQLNEQNEIPLFIGVDQEGGRITRLPGNWADIPTNETIGKMNNPAFANEIGSFLGQQVNAFGFNVNFAVLDVNSNPNNPIIGDRSFGNNADIVSNLGLETMEGIASHGVVPVIKHFPGHGDTGVDSHLELPTVNKTKEELYNLELQPFIQAINNGADMVMVAHILLPHLESEYPSSMSKAVITDLLRNELQYNGVVITDDMTMKAISDNYLLKQAAVQSINAGTDIIMVAHDVADMMTVMDGIKTAVVNGEISEDRIDESVERIKQLKSKYNLTDEAVQPVSVEELNNKLEQMLKEYME